MKQNPIMKSFTGQFEEIPFSKITIDDYMPAINKGIEEANNVIFNITKNKEVPNFKNTIEELETSSYLLDKATSLYFNICCKF